MQRYSGAAAGRTRADSCQRIKDPGIPGSVLLEMKKKSTEREKGREKNKEKTKSQRAWIVSITVCAFFLSVFMNLFSDMLMRRSDIIAAFIILITIVVIGILFDMVGVAVAVADAAPFHSMASHRVKGARSSLMLIRNAAKVSSLCNDVVGDTCGIISGTSAAYIVTQLSDAGLMEYALLSLLLSGIIASMTIGGKALGKEFAMSRSKKIVTYIGRLIAVFAEHRK